MPTSPLASQLPPRRDLKSLASQSARLAAVKAMPGRSIAVFARHHLPGRKPEQAQLREMARALLEAARPVPAAVDPWLTLEEAAARMQLPVTALRQRLKDPEFRRTWGWPRCLDGERLWRFNPAFFGDRAAAAAADLPREEPPHQIPPGHAPTIRVGADPAAPAREPA